MVDNHWVRYDTDEPFIPNLDKFGFVYVITNTQTTKAYVGCKQYYIGKTKKASKWESYMSSSKYVKEDIKKIGKKHFKFEAIAEYKNKRSLLYYEAYYQIKWNVLTATLKDSDEQAFYNGYVGGKWYRPIESYTPHTEETKRKISDAHKGEKSYRYLGKAEFYLDGKQMVVDCLGVWCDENGYNRGALNSIARTNRDGFYINKGRKGAGLPVGKARAFSCNGPSGTITKVKWLGKEENDVNKKSNVRHSTS